MPINKNKKLKLFTQNGNDCWKISICNCLGMSPNKVPHFVKLYGENFVTKTREWLNKRGKTITYVPFSVFLDTGVKYNNNLFPEGKCIAYVQPDKEGNAAHACLMINGELFEKGSSNYETIHGYFIIHNIT